MIGILIFAASFFGFFTVTTIFPILPPGSLFIHLFGGSGSNLIIGMNSDLFVSAIFNGFCWALIVTLVFFFIRGPGNKKSELPIWVPGYAKSNNS